MDRGAGVGTDPAAPEGLLGQPRADGLDCRAEDGSGCRRIMYWRPGTRGDPAGARLKLRDPSADGSLGRVERGSGRRVADRSPVAGGDAALAEDLRDDRADRMDRRVEQGTQGGVPDGGADAARAVAEARAVDRGRDGSAGLPVGSDRPGERAGDPRAHRTQERVGRWPVDRIDDRCAETGADPPGPGLPWRQDVADRGGLQPEDWPRSGVPDGRTRAGTGSPPESPGSEGLHRQLRPDRLACGIERGADRGRVLYRGTAVRGDPAAEEGQPGKAGTDRPERQRVERSGRAGGRHPGSRSTGNGHSGDGREVRGVVRSRVLDRGAAAPHDSPGTEGSVSGIGREAAVDETCGRMMRPACADCRA